MTSPSRQLRALSSAFGAAVLYALLSPLTVLGLAGGYALAPTLAARYATAAVLAGAFAVRARGPGHRRVAWFALGATVQAAVALLGLGALRVLPVSVAVGLFFTYPLWAVLIGYASGSAAPRSRHFIGAICVLAGVVLLAEPVAELGLEAWMVLAAAAFYALQLHLAARLAQPRRDGTTSDGGAPWLFTGSATSLGAYASWTGQSAMPLDGYAFAAVTGVMCAFLPWRLLMHALPRLGVPRTTLVTASEPLIAASLSALLLHQPFGPLRLLACTLITAGAVTAIEWGHTGTSRGSAHPLIRSSARPLIR